MTARPSTDAPVASPGSWPMRRPPSRAMTNAYAAIEMQALVTAHAEIEDRAIAYACDPRQLDAICVGLSALPTDHLIEALESAIRHMNPMRNWGFGGCVPALNLHGALLYAHRLKAAQEKFP